MPFQLSTRLVTAHDPDASKVPPVACTGCGTLTVGAVSDTAGATLTYRIVLTDSQGHVQGTWGPFSLVCGPGTPGPDWGTEYLGMDSGQNQPTLPIVADFAYLKVDSVSPKSTWTLAAGAR